MELTAEIFSKIRFGETDAMGVVWHGNYLKYFEDAREAFGIQHEITYLDIYKKGFFTPIVKTGVEYKSPLYYGDRARVTAILEPSRAAKISFRYTIHNHETGLLSAEGFSVQVFLNVKSRTLELLKPDFYKDWETLKGLNQ